MAPRKPPWGKRQQIETGPIDEVLNASARANHPASVWWYGRAGPDPTRRLVCYICDEELLPTSPAYALKADDVQVVMEHRRLEIERARPHVHSTTEESQS